jgi:hypothetical protein
MCDLPHQDRPKNLHLQNPKDWRNTKIKNENNPSNSH